MDTQSIDRQYVNGLKEALDEAIRNKQDFFVFNGRDYFRDYAKYFIEYAARELMGDKTALFRSGQAIIVPEKGHGKVTGYVGYHPNRMQVRVQFDMGEIRDYNQFTLFSLAEGAQL